MSKYIIKHITLPRTGRLVHKYRFPATWHKMRRLRKNEVTQPGDRVTALGEYKTDLAFGKRVVKSHQLFTTGHYTSDSQAGYYWRRVS